MIKGGVLPSFRLLPADCDRVISVYVSGKVRGTRRLQEVPGSPSPWTFAVRQSTPRSRRLGLYIYKFRGEKFLVEYVSYKKASL